MIRLKLFVYTMSHPPIKSPSVVFRWKIGYSISPLYLSVLHPDITGSQQSIHTLNHSSRLQSATTLNPSLTSPDYYFHKIHQAESWVSDLDQCKRDCQAFYIKKCKDLDYPACFSLVTVIDCRILSA